MSILEVIDSEEFARMIGNYIRDTGKRPASVTVPKDTRIVVRSTPGLFPELPRVFAVQSGSLIFGIPIKIKKVSRVIFEA